MLWSESPTTQTLRRACPSRMTSSFWATVRVLVLVDEHVLEPVLSSCSSTSGWSRNSAPCGRGGRRSPSRWRRRAGARTRRRPGRSAPRRSCPPAPGAPTRRSGPTWPELIAPSTARGGKRLLVDAEVVEDVLHEPPAVTVVVDREAGAVADPLDVAAQHPHAGGSGRSRSTSARPPTRRARRRGGASRRRPCW